jgi:hypothetical protein
MVTYGADCSLQKIQIKWPRIVKIDSQPENTLSFQDALNWAKQIYSEAQDGERNDSTVNTEGANITGMATAWKFIEEKNVLTPCYLFEAQLTMANGDISQYRIEVPRLSKYVK